MRKTIDTIFENRVSLSKQASKQASKLLYAKFKDWRSIYLGLSILQRNGVRDI